MFHFFIYHFSCCYFLVVVVVVVAATVFCFVFSLIYLLVFRIHFFFSYCCCFRHLIRVLETKVTTHIGFCLGKTSCKRKKKTKILCVYIQKVRSVSDTYKEGYVVVIFNWIYDRWILFHHHHLRLPRLSSSLNNIVMAVRFAYIVYCFCCFSFVLISTRIRLTCFGRQFCSVFRYFYRAQRRIYHLLDYYDFKASGKKERTNEKKKLLFSMLKSSMGKTMTQVFMIDFDFVFHFKHTLLCMAWSVWISFWYITCLTRFTFSLQIIN